ncbi:MAG: ribonuclease H-like domain-containing protein [Lachnospiraceae bacterium]|nr:ribonuclease H-like domain-containing protein [Lachnospiraceae bacterium]
MKTENTTLNNFELSYPLHRIFPLEDTLFIDIETTGFLSSSSFIYLIGCAFYYNDNWIIKQFFAQDPEDERAVLEEFFEFAKSFSFLVHYNGNSFDIPFINNRAKKHDLNNTIEGMDGLDIYRRINTYRNLLKLPDCKLKTIEMFLDIDRDDEYSGGELIEVYKDYLKSHDFTSYQTLLLHNSDDIRGMLEILPILSYYDLFNNEITATKVTSSVYPDMNGIIRKELMINIAFSGTLPNPITFMGRGCYFKASENSGTLVVPIYEEEMKFFYANYKEYYYLPLEDMALHRSVATFVDSEFREPAKASNCYTRKISEFLPQWSVLFQPFFKREYDSTDLFFEMTDELKRDRNAFSVYASHVMQAIAFQK